MTIMVENKSKKLPTYIAMKIFSKITAKTTKHSSQQRTHWNIS